MKKRTLKVKLLTSMLVISMLMTSFTPLMSKAEELPEEDTESQEEVVEASDAEETNEDVSEEPEIQEDSEDETEETDVTTTEANEDTPDPITTSDDTNDDEPTEITDPAETEETFIVTFIDSITNEKFTSVEVKKDESIEPENLPEAPKHDGYIFSKYEGNYTEVIKYEEVTAIYDPIDDFDATELMFKLIEEAIQENQDDGIIGALDATFEVLAENKEMLSNPQTGELGVSGEEIVEATKETMDEYFEAPSDDMIGAIEAAAYRADEVGYISTIGGDSYLANMAAHEAAMKTDCPKYVKTTYESALDSIGTLCPEFRPYVPLIKAILGGITSDSSNSAYQEINDNLEKLEQQIQNSERSIKNHTYNVVNLSNIGGKYDKVKDKSETVRTEIGNINLDTELSEGERIQKIANLKNSSEFLALESAMNGATDCFYSTANDIFGCNNIFDATWNQASSQVMFGREILYVSMPYITRQLAYYTAAYTTMDEVYSAYETVYGSSKLFASREKMSKHLSGKDLNGNVVCQSVYEKVGDYFGRDPYILVDKGTSHVKLNKCIVVNRIHHDEAYTEHDYYETDMKCMPVTQKQVEDIIKYAGNRNRTPFDFLFNDMQFQPVNGSDRFIKLLESCNDDLTTNGPTIKLSGFKEFNEMQIKDNKKLIESSKLSPYNRIGDKWIGSPTQKIYIACGAQAFRYTRTDRYETYKAVCNMARADRINAETETETWFYRVIDGLKSTWWTGHGNRDLLIFQR